MKGVCMHFIVWTIIGLVLGLHEVGEGGHQVVIVRTSGPKWFGFVHGLEQAR